MTMSEKVMTDTTEKLPASHDPLSTEGAEPPSCPAAGVRINKATTILQCVNWLVRIKQWVVSAHSASQVWQRLAPKIGQQPVDQLSLRLIRHGMSGESR
jgi:hypothetical protein